MTRAAVAAQQHPGRLAGRSVSPPPANGLTKTTIMEGTEAFSVVPGEGGIPALPRGANGSFESLDELEASVNGVEVLRGGETRDSFEWPDDVF